MKIKYFAWLKNITNKENEFVDDTNIKDIISLKKYLIQQYPKLEEYLKKEDYLRVAVNLKYTSSNKKLFKNDEIAIFPPVSGG